MSWIKSPAHSSTWNTSSTSILKYFDIRSINSADIYYGKRDFEAREIGYIVNQNFQRKGYALEAITAVIDNAFANGVHRVFAECDPRNECSWKLLERAGLDREAHF